MTVKTGGTAMSSGRAVRTARRAPGRNGRGVSGLPGQTLDRNTAITAMVLAGTAAAHDLHDEHRPWPADQAIREPAAGQARAAEAEAR